MFFTQEDYRKIEKWLLANSVKDTEFAGASLPLKGNETVAFVQDGKNVNVLLKDLIEQIFLLGVSDFLNVTDKYGESRISLTQAIQLIPYKSRKIGQVITFLDEDGEWKLFQFQGERVNQWNNATLWVDLIERIQGISIIDSEDITATVDNLNQTSLTFADKNYNTTDYSGLGRVYLRKNIQTVVNPNTGITYSTNLLTQQMLNKENTIYVLQYDYSLNYQTISIPEGSILVFEGGDINNGTLNCNSTIIVGKFRGNATIAGTYSFQDAQADEEDITQSQSSVLKFKNKGYDEANFSGLGRTYLRKNIVNGVNVLTQDMINNPNTIYHIQYDYNLNGQTITIPSGCVLLFEGGSISNGNINFVNTTIESNYPMFDCKLQGSITNSILKVLWVKNSNSQNIQNLIDISSSNSIIEFEKREYILTKNLDLPSTIPGNDDQPCLTISNKKNLIIEGNGAVLTSTVHAQGILEVFHSTDCIIRNLILNGYTTQVPLDGTTGRGEKGTNLDKYNTAGFWGYNKNNSFDTSTKIDKYGNPWGMFGDGYIGNIGIGLLIYRGSKNITVSNVEAYNFNYAGIQVGYYGDILAKINEQCVNITINNCNTHDIYECGITVKDCDTFYISNCYCNNIGHKDALPTDTVCDPGYGITCNGVFDVYNTHGVIINNIISNCKRKGIDFHAGKQAVISNNIVTGCYVGGIYSVASSPTQRALDILISTNTISDCSFSNGSEGGIMVGGYSLDKTSDMISTNIKVSNNKLTNIGASNNRGVIIAYCGKNIEISNNTIDNSEGKYVAEADIWAGLSSPADSSENIVIENNNIISSVSKYSIRPFNITKCNIIGNIYKNISSQGGICIYITAIGNTGSIIDNKYYGIPLNNLSYSMLSFNGEMHGNYSQNGGICYPEYACTPYIEHTQPNRHVYQITPRNLGTQLFDTNLDILMYSGENGIWHNPDGTSIDKVIIL